MRHFLFPVIILACWLHCTSATATRPAASPGFCQESDKQETVVEFVDTFERRYATREPKVGDQLPQANAFDDQGRPFELESTRGKYTVLVFGCLT